MRSTKNANSSAPVRTTAELADRLGLSRWTVSRVLNGHAGVHPETALRVREAMKALDFSPSPLAQGLRKGSTNMVGVCLPELEGLYLSRKLEFLREALAKEGFHAMVALTNGEAGEEAVALNRFRVLRAAGVILVSSQLAVQRTPIRQFHEAQIPLLIVDPLVKPSKGSLCVNRAAGMKEAMEHLFELGHRHIAALGLIGESRYSRLRLQGIEEAYRERGLNPAKFIRKLALAGSWNSFYQAGKESAATLLRGPAPLTAVLALNDRVAIGLIDGLRALGIKVPRDLSVVGYDNMEVGAFISPRITTIDAQPDELIAQTTSRLLRLIRRPKAAIESTINIPARLIIRASTGPVPHG